MDEEIFEQAKENDLTFEEAEELQDFKDETGLEGDKNIFSYFLLPTLV